MVFNPTFNNILVISWQSVLLVEETGVSRENHRPVVSHWQTLSHNVEENHRPVASHWQTLSHNVVHLALIEKTTDLSQVTDKLYHIMLLSWWSVLLVEETGVPGENLYRGGQFYWWRKPEDPEKTITCRKSLTNFIT